MINKSFITNLLTTSLAVCTIVLLGGLSSEANGQMRDPFSKPGWAKTRDAKGGGTGARKPDGPPVNLGLPPIQSRIEYYKRIRESAAMNGQTLPKVTSVLSLNEMSVTGIFKTPRGYAAMVEATPIKLSYTIYPGEKFFDGQLVAVEENRLVFRKVTKMSNGKFVSSVENMPLRKYTQREEIQGTAPAAGEATAQAQPVSAPTVPVAATDAAKAPAEIVSPFDEMNKQAASPDAEKSKKPAKKPVRVAKKKQ